MANSKFHHEEILRGKDLAQKLSAKQLVVCGGGAIGSNLVDSLVRQGFSKIRLIDMDRVEIHNLNTQTFDEGDVGATKANAIQTKAYRAVGVEVEAVSKELNKGNAKKLLKGADLVIDAFDNSTSRQLVRDECWKQQIPCLHAGLHAEYGEVVWDQVYKVPKDTGEDICDYPLARNLAMFVVAMTCEEIVDFCLSDKPRFESRCITLSDLKISPY